MLVRFLTSQGTAKVPETPWDAAAANLACRYLRNGEECPLCDGLIGDPELALQEMIA